MSPTCATRPLTILSHSPNARARIHSSRTPSRCICSDFERFGKVVHLRGFKPFSSAAEGLAQINAVSESGVTDELEAFLSLNLPKTAGADKKKKKSSGGAAASFRLGVSEPKLGSSVQDAWASPAFPTTTWWRFSAA